MRKADSDSDRRQARNLDESGTWDLALEGRQFRGLGPDLRARMAQFHSLRMLRMEMISRNEGPPAVEVVPRHLAACWLAG